MSLGKALVDRQIIAIIRSLSFSYTLKTYIIHVVTTMTNLANNIMNIFKFIIIVYTTTEGKLSPDQYRQQYYRNNKII